MALTTTSPRRDENRRVMALATLFAGATAIATSALFVKVSEAGPVSTAFWRVFLALPFLWAWALFENRPQHFENFTRDRRFMVLAGVFFAGDLAVWHWSIVLTSVANATLLANLAPIFVTLAAWLLFRKTPSALFIVGMATALVSGEQFFPASTMGWVKLLGLALIAQVAGQSLIAYAMAHLPATFSSVGLLLQPVMAALFAWILLGETMGAVQIAGGVLVLIGIRIAHQAGRDR
ncbi:MAG: DMT family transporter [Burkholderiales bacterium]|nr:DMT family transporter [Burkholderiales bacterium]